MTALLRREFLMGAVGIAGYAIGPHAQPRATPTAQTQLDPRGRPIWGPPYSEEELRGAERRLGLKFPPDLFELFLRHRFAGGFDWTKDDEAIRSAMAEPLEGILLDVERGRLWLPEWGRKPSAPDERARIVTQAVTAAPRLIPLMPGRFIAETPHERGNPVFFVFLGDVRYFGADLVDFVRRLSAPAGRWGPVRQKKPIPFWTRLSQLEIANP